MIRYRISKALFDLGLWIMPDSRYKRRLLDHLWALRVEVGRAVRRHRGGLFAQLTPEQQKAVLENREVDI